MKAGTLNTRITIQRRTGGEDAWGAPLPAGWEDVAKVWANVRHVSGSEMIRADADVSKVKASIRIRWRCGIDAGMRVLIGQSVYLVDAVLPDMQKREHVDIVATLEV